MYVERENDATRECLASDGAGEETETTAPMAVMPQRRYKGGRVMATRMTTRRSVSAFSSNLIFVHEMKPVGVDESRRSRALIYLIFNIFYFLR